MGRYLANIKYRLNRPCDAAGLAAFRILFGALMVFAVIRFAAKGWIKELYVEPSFHFTYLGFDWIKAWPGSGMYLHFALMGAASVFIMVGYRTRVSALAFVLLFSYVELIDKTVYLNHYYLVSLLACILVVVPSETIWSLDASKRGRDPVVPAYSYYLFRFQIAVVYLYAGIAKLNHDWLFEAQPLRTWLQMYGDWPWVGSLMTSSTLAFLMSWAGAFYDLTIVGLLLSSRFRPFAYIMVAVFHLIVWLLFPIGIFPWVMMISTTMFFLPSWPRTILRWIARTDEPNNDTAVVIGAVKPIGGGLFCLLTIYIALQIAIPARGFLYPHQLNWTEQGFRFSWRVMLIEKTGQVEYRVVSNGGEKRTLVFPRSELTALQYKMMSTQPDMIHQYAHHLAARFRGRGHTDVRVYADAWAALNARKSQPLIDPTVDLASVARTLGHSDWILPLDTEKRSDSINAELIFERPDCLMDGLSQMMEHTAGTLPQ